MSASLVALPPPPERMNMRVLGIGICSTWAPSQASSSGSSVNVPLDRTLTMLQPCVQPWYVFCQAFMWRQPPPIGSKGSPYSLCVQLPWGVSWKDADPQSIDDECCMPKLCPGS